MEKCLFSPTVGRFWGYHFIPNERPLKPSWLRFDCFGRLSHTGNVLAAEAKVDAFPCDLSTPIFLSVPFYLLQQANVAPTWRCKRCRGCSISHNSKCVSLQICARIPTGIAGHASVGERKYPETSALLRKNKAQAAAANAIKEVLQERPARGAHKQAIVGKLRGRMTTQEWNDYFTCVSRAYANKAAKVEKQLAERKAKGDVVPIDIFAQKQTRDE
eukprot:g58606.t1